MKDTRNEAGWLIGLMSGTSADGIDAALLWSDGRQELQPGPACYHAYDTDFRARLMACYGGKGDIAAIERELTIHHANSVTELLKISGRSAKEIVAIGFHGQTILHAPERGLTWQIGDGRLLAELTGIDVVNDFRKQDVAAGGEGAPLIPVFHRALSGALEKPVAFLNIGGVANVTWVGVEEESQSSIFAFDTGPGNALIDDWVRRHLGLDCDRSGKVAEAGNVDRQVLDRLIADPYFQRHPPKSLDRDHFRTLAEQTTMGLSVADGAATLTAFTALSIARAEGHFPAPVRSWILGGGGRHNPILMRALAENLRAPLQDIGVLGWDGDQLEAMAFAYLAMRSIKNLPLSYPGTTGVRTPQIGGKRHRPNP